MLRRIMSGLLTSLAVVALWLLLVLPADLRDLDSRLVLLIPAEGLALLAVMLWAPARVVEQVVRWGGRLLALVLVVRLLDLGFDFVFDRQLDLVNDWVYLRSGVDVIAYGYGWFGVLVALVVSLALIAGLVVALPRVLGRVARSVSRHRGSAQVVFIGLTVRVVDGGRCGLAYVAADSGGRSHGSDRCAGQGPAERGRAEGSAQVRRRSRHRRVR